MNVPRHVIIDLLPLYFEEDVSEDTRKWIETYLENDPELFAVVQQTHARVPANIPLPVNKETEMEAFKKVKRLMVRAQPVPSGGDPDHLFDRHGLSVRIGRHAGRALCAAGPGSLLLGRFLPDQPAIRRLKQA